ncbi:MAG: hypothetical protein ACT4QG_04585 [Sporichthyaceae bacterium]
MTDSQTAPAAEPAPNPRVRRPSPVVAVLSVALVLALVFAGWMGLKVRSDNDREDARRAVVAAANGYAVDLTTYNHSRLEADFQKVLDNSTGTFRSEYTAASASLRELIAKFKATATGKVLDSAVVLSSDEDNAVVLLFVDQTVANSNSKEPRVDRSRMKMGLEKQGGRWLINALDLL